MTDVYAFATFRPNGSSAIDAGSNTGVFIEMLFIPGSSTSGSKTYPTVPAGYLYCVNVAGGSHDFSIDNDPSTGKARLNWELRSYGTDDTRLMVFAYKIDNVDQYAMELLNAKGGTLVDYFYPVPQYVGSIQPGVNATSAFATPTNLKGNVHTTPVVNFRPGTNRLVLLNIPDSGSADIWYTCDCFVPASNTSGFSLTVTVFAPAGVAYQVPTMHVFSLENPQASTDGYKIVTSKADSSLVYDSGMENMYVKDSAIVDFPFFQENTVTYTFNMPSVAGICIPYFTSKSFGPSEDTTGVATVKRVGNQLTFRTTLVTKTVYNPPRASYIGHGEFVGSATNSLCLLSDVSQLSASSSPGTPGTVPFAAPVITQQPVNQSVNRGSTVTFSITATGYPAPTYQWTDGGTPISGATASTLSFVTSDNDNQKLFNCVVKNTTTQQNTVNSTFATLTVLDPNASGVPPSITSNPVNQSASVGSAVSFSASASGSQPFTYAWRKSGNSTVIGTGQTLTFTVSSGSGGSYYCTITNAYGSAVSTAATLSVGGSGGGGGDTVPVISQQPVSVVTTQNVGVTLTCTAAPVTSQEWYRDGNLVGSGSSHSPDVSTPGSFQYLNVCRNNTASQTSSPATLTVTVAGAAPFASYNNVAAGVVQLYDVAAEWSISIDGSTSQGGNWANRGVNGEGDGNLYTHTATVTGGVYVPDQGASAVGVAYTGSATWAQSLPTSTGHNVSRTCSLSIATKLNGTTVCTHTVTLQSTNS